ncbi:MAG: RidA family protein [Geminicoccaceae bacterium]|nr:RidA family protein [Geminicoccaceae bacterium]
MTSAVERRLENAGMTLPEAAAAAGNYVPFTKSGTTLYVSGQVPFEAGRIAVSGRLGDGVSLEDGQEAARICALNILAQARAALDGDLDRVVRCLKLGGFVAATAEFTDHPKVINGASDLMVTAFEDAGRHARFAVGVASLPLGAAVEVDAIFEIRS